MKKKQPTSIAPVSGAGVSADEHDADDDALARIFHPSPELNRKIREAAPELQNYILALHAVIAHLQIEDLAAQGSIVPGGPKGGKKKTRNHGVDMGLLREMIYGKRESETE